MLSNVHVTFRCQYFTCVPQKIGLPFGPELRNCTPGKSVPENFVGGYGRVACTEDDLTCVGGIQILSYLNKIKLKLICHVTWNSCTYRCRKDKNKSTR